MSNLPLFCFPNARLPRYKLLIVLVLLTIATASAVPLYMAGNWTLNKVPELGNIQALRSLQRTGLTLPGWETLEQETVEIGGHKWSVQSIAPSAASTAAVPKPAAPKLTALLMLRPQTWHRDLPQVDWMDLSGAQSWTEDDSRPLQLSIVTDAKEPVQVNARFLRGWTNEQAYAVLQWYAWKDGGSAVPGDWFWAEQRSQLRDRQHLSWVGVSLLLPIQPLDEIESVQPQIEALGRLVQSSLANSFLS
ncbi:cyanoexosortase B system-associated protein [Phormidium tenue FACHB-886]|nr:cyanoexosortase B system-associated protein [Phormidium tenue FACHB-886]